MNNELLYTQEDIDEWIRTCELLQEKVREQEETIEQLSEYKSLENRIEDGSTVFVKLPCGIGTTVYYCSNRHIFTFTFDLYKITNEKVFLYLKGSEGQSFTGLQLEADCEGNILNSERIFFARAEAEKKLKELKGEK